MIRRLRIGWPDRRPFVDRGGASIRWLLVSDVEDPALGHDVNRSDLGTVDTILGGGDLEPEYLGFLADAFAAPVAYIRGNHDHGGLWTEPERSPAPLPLRTGRIHPIDGIAVIAFEWPGLRHGDRRRHDGSAWVDALRAAAVRPLHRMGRGAGPTAVLSHAPPRGVGDRAADPYHVGFAAYRWLLDRWRPPLWLHGHVPPASVERWRIEHRGSTVVNMTGAILLEIVPDGQGSGPAGDADRDGQNGGQGMAGQVGEG